MHRKTSLKSLFSRNNTLQPLRKRGFNSLSTKKQCLCVFLIALVLTSFIYVIFMIQDGGAFFFYGDYNVQQIPFYMEANRAIKAGEFMWDFNTDLGINFLGSYTFYLLGSPFFWISLLFPFKMMAYVLPYLMGLKIATAALFAFIFIKRYVKKSDFAMFSALLYAFSGFTIYNIFFNHFTESIAFFPLLLIGMDKLIYDDKKGFFIIAVFLNAAANYYFFIAECVFLLIYFFVRVVTNSYPTLTVKKYTLVFVEGFLGIGIAAVFLIISFLAVIQIDRASTKLSGLDILLYNDIQIYPNILEAFFMPPEIPAFPNLFSKIGARWSSVAAWLPLFSMTGVIAYVMRKRKDWLSYLIPIFFIMAFIPILNSSFQLFSNSFYTRWFFMLILLMALATGIALETLSDKIWTKSIIITAIITFLIAVPVGLIKDSSKSAEHFPDNTLVRDFKVYILYAIIALGAVLAVFLLIKVVKRSSKHFSLLTFGAISIVIVVVGMNSLALGRVYKTEPRDAKEFISKNINGREKITLPDIDNVRTDVVNGMDNQTLYWQIPGLQAFHSIVPGSVTDFYMSLGVQRDVGSRPDKSHLWLRSLVGVKYLFDDDNVDNLNMRGFEKIDEVNGFTVYENQNYLPFGFAYDNYVDKAYFEAMPKNEREKLLLNAVLLSQEQIDKYGKNLTELPDIGEYYISDDEAESYTKDRKSMAITSFTKGKNSFKANITLTKDNLVCFSFPYEKGWSATVDGKQVPIEKVNNGLMAVPCKEGISNIEFNYVTPGLKSGLIISGISILLALIYVFVLAKRKII
ncbi:MAG: YfhO family protein [Clostridia bacterium]